MTFSKHVFDAISNIVFNYHLITGNIFYAFVV